MRKVEQTAEEEEDCGRCILSGRIVLPSSRSEFKSLQQSLESEKRARGRGDAQVPLYHCAVPSGRILSA